MIRSLCKVLIVLCLLAEIGCQDENAPFDPQLCENCRDNDFIPRIGGSKVELVGKAFRYAASIYQRESYNVKNEHDVQVDRGPLYTLLCSAVIVNAQHVLTSYAC